MNKINVLRAIETQDDEQKLVLNNIIKELEEKEKKQLYGGNRVAGIKTLMTTLKRNCRKNLIGYLKYSDKFCFTDTYIIVALNNDTGYNEAPSPIEENVLELLFNGSKKQLHIDNEALSSMIIRGEDSIELEGVKFEIKALKLLLKIIGKVESFYLINDTLYVENLNNEYGVVKGKII